jgi:ABC-type branched-subunit amino acid transport system ATPase component
MKPRYEGILNLKRQTGNRWNAAGITAREAVQLYEMFKKLDKLKKKKHLWVRHRMDLDDAITKIIKVLDDAGRLA